MDGMARRRRRARKAVDAKEAYADFHLYRMDIMQIYEKLQRFERSMEQLDRRAVARDFDEAIASLSRASGSLRKAMATLHDIGRQRR